MSTAVAAVTCLAALGTLLVASEKPAAAQEIQLTGPLAGAPAVRRLRQYREGRFELALGPGFTLLDEYQRTIFAAGRLQYNIFDWLGVGVFGGYGVLSLNTDLTDRIDSTAPRNSRTAINVPPKTGQGAQAFDKQTFKQKWMVNPQLTFAPFRGKLALFQKLFIDTDLYVHGGVVVLGVEERKECAVGRCSAASNAGAFGVDSRVAWGPSFGLGLTLYAANFISINAEYRAYPLVGGSNRGGFDSRGGGPDASFPDNRIDSEDRTFKFNQMVFIGAGFYLPTKPKISD